MQWTGNIARTFGWLMTALGSVGLVAGLGALFFGLSWMRDVHVSGQRPHDDVGDLLGRLIVGGGAVAAVALAALVIGIVLLGVARALRDRRDRRAASTPALVGPPHQPVD